MYELIYSYNVKHNENYIGKKINSKKFKSLEELQQFIEKSKKYYLNYKTKHIFELKEIKEMY